MEKFSRRSRSRSRCSIIHRLTHSEEVINRKMFCMMQAHPGPAQANDLSAVFRPKNGDEYLREGVPRGEFNRRC